MGDVWFTSDTHFGHRHVAETRGYATSEEHDEALIDRWNGMVRPQDLVWHLGDVGSGPYTANRTEDLLDTVRRLHGEIHLVAGNHDAVHPMWRDAYGRSVLLSHLPYEGDHTTPERYPEYRLRDCGIPMLCGHVHDLWKTQVSSVGTPQVNVGIDIWGSPVPLEIVADLLPAGARDGR